MLLRVRGGLKGIAHYLETGQKRGRKETRDELDERVVLVGDLDAMDRAVKTLAKGKEKYLHITMSFKEDSVLPGVLKEIAKKFEGFVKSGFRDDELMCYAEAHVPRIKSLEVGGSEKRVDRLAHIHFVVPKLNLLTGKYAEPLGRVKSQIEYLAAFQESINEEYGLASPRDNRRHGFQSGATVVGRHTGDNLFGGINRELKAKILQAVLERNISTSKELGIHLQTLGRVRVRNEGRLGSYYNLTTPGEPKGVNLREAVFSQEFLALSREEKEAQANPPPKRAKFLEAGPRRRPHGDHLNLLEEWRELRSKEIKYLNSGNKAQRAAYHKMTREEKMNYIGGLEAKHYEAIAKTQAPQNELPLEISGDPEAEPINGPQMLNASDSTLGRRIHEAVDAELDRVYHSRLSKNDISGSLGAVGAYLETKYQVPLDKFAKPMRLACAGGTHGVFEFFRRTMNLAPTISWASLVKLRLIEPKGQFASAENTVSDLLLEEFRRRQAALEEDRELAEAGRRHALSILQMSLVLSRKHLWAQYQLQHDHELAPNLRVVNTIAGQWEIPKPYEPAQVFVAADWDHQTNQQGQVEFLRKQKKVIRDEDKRLVLEQTDVQVVEVALRLAVMKFGNRLTIRGEDDFKKTVVEVAAGMKLKIEFNDPQLQRDLVARRNLLRKVIEY